MRAAGSATRSSARATGNRGIASRILRTLGGSSSFQGSGAPTFVEPASAASTPGGSVSFTRGAVKAKSLTVSMALVMVVVMAVAASAAPKGVVGSFGSAGPAGGEFSSTPRGIAVNDATGDLYVVDGGNHRLQRFDDEGGFISAWGADVIPNGATGTGTLTSGSSAVSAVVVTSKAFAVGQVVTGVGIPANTRITAVGNGPDTGGFGLTLSQNATASGTDVVLTVATGTGNVAVNERQSLTLGPNTTGGTFTLRWTTALGRGVITAGSSTIASVTAVAPTISTPVRGRIRVGDTIVGSGIPPGTTITAVGTTTLAMSNPATSGFETPQSLTISEVTSPIAFDAPAGGVEAAVEALPDVGADSISVTKPGALQWMVEFDGAYADSNVAQLATVATGLAVDSGSPTATMSTRLEGGVASERCSIAAQCKPGVTTPVTAPGGMLSAPQGVALNQVTGDVYVTNAALQRVEQYEDDGTWVRSWGRDIVQTGRPGDSPPASAVQTLTVDASAGTFTLTFRGQTTAALAFNVSAGSLQTALQGLGTIGAGNVLVTPAGATGGAGGGTPYGITFAGALANTPQPLISAASGTDPLAGGGGTASVVSTTPGSTGFEICTTTTDCQKGAAGGTAGAFAGVLGYPAVVPAGAPGAGNVVIAEPLTGRVEEFEADGDWVRAFGYDVVAGNAVTTFEVCSPASPGFCKAGAMATTANAGQFGSAAVTRVAAGPDGAIFTVEPDINFRVQKFTPAAGSLTPSVFNPVISASPSETLNGSSVATAPTDVAVANGGHLYVVKASGTERRIYEFTTAGSGSLVETHAADYGVPAVNGMAVGLSGGQLAVTTSAPGVMLLGDPVAPTLTVQPTTAVATTTATLHGTVNPNGGAASLQTSYRFEYSVDGIDWTKAPASDVVLGFDSVDHPVSQNVTGLEPNRAYRVRLVGIKGGGASNSSGTAGNFTTEPAAPTVATYPAWFDDAASELVLEAGVNPNNSSTTYRFEYGTAPCDSNPCTSVPAAGASAGSGGQTVTVSARVSRLEPGTTYHYRAVAGNGVEISSGQTEVAGSDRTFTTPADDGECANARLRIGPSAGLPDCMAYEWVSRGDTWGLGINANRALAGASGDRAQFTAQAFEVPESAPSWLMEYTATRSATGWSARSLTPEPGRVVGSSRPPIYSASLDRAVWLVGTQEQRMRSEVEWELVGLEGARVAASGRLIPVARVGQAEDGSDYALNGASADLSTFAFGHVADAGFGAVQFFGDEPFATTTPGWASHLYAMWDAGRGDGQFEIVNRATSPAPGVPGPVIGGTCGAHLGGGELDSSVTESVRRAVSSDGSVMYFTAAPGASSTAPCTPDTTDRARVFKRIENATTVQVSESRCVRVSPTCANDGIDRFVSASTDGAVVAFTTKRALTNSDIDSTSDVYLYDADPPAGQPNLVQASAGEAIAGHVVGDGAGVSKVFDVAADGSRAYFVASGALTAANDRGRSPVAGQRNLYAFQRDDDQPAGRLAFVATLAAGDPLGEGPNLVGGVPFHVLPLVEGQGDGHLLVFGSSAPLVGGDEDAVGDVYRYDDSSEELICLSCAGDGDVAARIAEVNPTESTAARSPIASADASTIVFTTREGLFAADVNGADDVYVWRNGTISQISSGTGVNGVAGPTSVSPDGQSVFFLTSAGLVGADVNRQLDMYVARVGGGFAENPAPPAACDPLTLNCRGSASSPLGGVFGPAPALPAGNMPSAVRARLVLSTVAAATRRRAVRSGVLPIVVTSSRAGTVQLTARARLGKTVRQVAATSARVAVGRKATVRLRLSRAARQQLRSGRALAVDIQARSRGARTRSLTVRLSGVRS